MSAFLLMPHGAQKLFGFLADPEKARPELFSQMGLAGVLEFFGGLAILIGLFTRPVAFVLAGEMAVAYFIAHAPAGFWPAMNGGDQAAVFCFVFLFLAFNDGGEWSVDAKLVGRNRAST